VARSGYIHPAVIDAYLDGSLDDMLANRDSKVRRGDAELRADERRALDLVDR
jgi:DNA topoisomerase IB